MEIKVLGPGCAKCKSTYNVIEKVLKENNIDAKLTKVDDIMEMMNYNIMTTPAVVIDEVVKMKGQVPTESDVKKIKEEIEYRKIVVRKKELEAVKEARAQGDLSENFEYKAAKKFKNENESRIRYLEKMIKTAVIVSEDSPEDEVGMNNTVDIYFEEDDVTETYKLVTTVRSNSLKNLISRESPLGAAIFGHKVGDRCEVHVNDNYSYFVQIKRIVNTMDDGTDELRKF